MDFRTFLKRSRPRRIRGLVDPNMEAARTCLEGPTIPWVARAKGKTGFELAGNVLSTRDLIASSLSTNRADLVELLLKAMEDPVPPLKVDRPPYYSRTTLSALPIPTFFKSDGGPYITSGIFHASFGNRSNLSFHRMMFMGKDRFAVRVVPRHLMALLKEAERGGGTLRAAVSLGCDTASLLSASCSMAFGQDELHVASALTMASEGKPLKVFDADGHGSLSPVGSEIVLTGEFTGERAPEGPFVDITSTIDDSGLDPGEPVFRVRSVLMRDDPIFHVLLPGGMEHYLMMGLPKEPSILQSVRKVVPRVRAVRLTEGGCCWLHGAVSIDKQKEGDGMNAIMAAFTGHPSMKRVLVVDQDIDIFDDVALEWALATRFNAGKGLLLVHGARGSTLDPSASSIDGTTSKMGMDATMPLGQGSMFERVIG
ncbi:MAG: UbiD family decarboxylase [Candidatus Thermoplasmatota archaeon]|jgi:UbiD family decarboxylase|nr:UbiD family decarboxylase [Candidatus Thermoplasmatota archaeon]